MVGQEQHPQTHTKYYCAIHRGSTHLGE